jgi:hypothetical protein
VTAFKHRFTFAEDVQTFYQMVRNYCRAVRHASVDRPVNGKFHPADELAEKISALMSDYTNGDRLMALASLVSATAESFREHQQAERRIC